MVCSSCGFAFAAVTGAGTSYPSPFSAHGIHFDIVDPFNLDGFSLHPLEEQALGVVASEKRKMDFKLGRAAAHRALSKIGISEHTPILRGEHREPLWPAGVVGSIAHASTFGVAAVAHVNTVSALGVDIQKIEERYTDHLIARFADPDEFEWVRSIPTKQTERAVRLFSAKESVFKALYPIGKVWFAFDVAHLSPCESEDRFHASVRLPAISNSLIHLDVGVVEYEQHIITGAVLTTEIVHQ